MVLLSLERLVLVFEDSEEKPKELDAEVPSQRLDKRQVMPASGAAGH
jgi:hypothetical protein